MNNNKVSILDCSIDELKKRFENLGLKPFVVKQVSEWIYKKNVITFDAMKNISKENKKKLNSVFFISPFKEIESLESKDNSAKKYILTLRDGAVIEAVVIRDRRYNTLCVSSQCGCPVDCKFCLTGINGFKRNLTVDEILGQLLIAKEDGQDISRLVFMGMGEPLLNYDNLFKAYDSITSEQGFHIGKRKITISTSGHLKLIQKLLDEQRFVNLAFSVGHPDPEMRVKVMPLEKNNPITEVSRVLKKYQSMHNRKLTLEYTLLKDVNDNNQTISELANLSKYLDAKINLINLNPHSSIPFEPVTSKKLAEVKARLSTLGVPVTVRFRKGDDILAACGQLKGSV